MIIIIIIILYCVVNSNRVDYYTTNQNLRKFHSQTDFFSFKSHLDIISWQFSDVEIILRGQNQ